MTEKKELNLEELEKVTGGNGQPVSNAIYIEDSGDTKQYDAKNLLTQVQQSQNPQK